MGYAKLGIRPVIDGRQGGVRESLEEKTMAMAEEAKKLIESSLKYADGTPVQVVIANTTIGGRGDAGKVSEQFANENIVGTLTVTPAWCYGTEVMDLDPTNVKAVWGFNGTERPGAVFLAASTAAYAQIGQPVFKIYGEHVQDMDDNSIPEEVQEKILSFAKGVFAIGQMKDKSYVNIGSSCMGIAGSQADAELFNKYLGINLEYVDMTEILRRITLEIYDKDEYEKALAWIKENLKEGRDLNEGKEFPEIITKSKVVPADEDWEFIAKHAIITRDIMFGNEKLAELGWEEEAKGRNAISGGFQGQRQWTDWLPNGDFTEAILNSTFDWNGPRPITPFATENDKLNGVSLMLGTLLTNTSPLFADVRTYWSPEAVERVTGHKLEGRAKDGIILLKNSGAAALDMNGAVKDSDGNPMLKEYWNMTEEDITNVINNTEWCRANYEYFRGGGYSSRWVLDGEMPITMYRVNLADGIGPTLQVAEGYAVEIDKEAEKIIDDRTDNTWPTTWFAPRLGEAGFDSVYDVMTNWESNHSSSVYGHVGHELLTLASMLRIPVVYHNIPRERIFRPHTFGAFGTENLEAADFKACETYGPLYK